MYGVTFGRKHSYNDFGLILSSKEIAPPEPKTYVIDIPGSDGQIDLSEVLTGNIKYKNRKLQFTFTCIDALNRWTVIYSEICNYLHGKVMEIILDSDKGYYFIGRCKVNQFKSSKRTAAIVIECDVDPYKYDINNNRGRQWLWDAFNLVEGVIRQSEINVRGETTVILRNGRKIVSPTIICSAPMTVTFDGVSYELNDGVNTVTHIRMKEGDNSLIFNGAGTITIEFERGSL